MLCLHGALAAANCRNRAAALDGPVVGGAGPPGQLPTRFLQRAAVACSWTSIADSPFRAA